MANNHILFFIQSLSDSEIKIVDDYLQKSQPLFVNEDNIVSKEHQLFKYIISNRCALIDDESIHQVMSIKDLSKLKVNLYNKVLESLTFDKYISNSKIFNENSKRIFKLKKKLLVFRVMFHSQNQKRVDAIEHLLDEIIDEAKENEIFDVLIEALTAKKYFSGIRLGLDVFNKIENEIEVYTIANKALYFATDCYYKLVMNREFVRSISKKELEIHLNSSIDQIQSDFNKTKSQQINYYLHILQFARAEQQGDFAKAAECCKKLILLLKTNKIIYREERMGLAYINLSQYETFLRNYKEARISSSAAQRFYREDSFNYLMSIEQEFHINFYYNEYEKALICVNKLLNHSLADAGKFRKSKYIYYEACVLFARKQYKQASMLLAKSLEIEQDKGGWNISLRILNIQIFIELDRIDEATFSLEALRKYIERIAKRNDVKERYVLIVKSLREMEKTQFIIDTQNKTLLEIFKKLSRADSDVSWEYFSPELIPFHEWVEKRMEKLSL